MLPAATRGSVAAAALALTWLAAPSTAHACSLAYCDPPLAYPETPTIPIDQARVFLNPGHLGQTPPDTSQVELSYAPPGSTVFSVVPASVQDVPDETRPRVTVGTSAALAVGGRLRLAAPDACAAVQSPPTLVVVGEWTLGDAVATPSALGTVGIVADARDTIEMPGGSACSYEEIRSHVDVALTLDASAEPWSERMHLSTWVDGVLHVASQSIGDSTTLSTSFAPRGGSVHGFGRDRLVARCADGEIGGYAPGVHTVQFRAALPDGTTLASESLAIELRCPSARQARSCAVHNAGAPASLPRSALASAVALGVWLRRRQSGRLRGA